MKLHFRSQSFFFLSFFFCYIVSSNYAVTIPPTNNAMPANGEPSILLSIKSSLADPLNRLHDWKNDPPSSGNSQAAPHHCTWTGVSCNAEGAVEELDLSHMNLSGTVSDDFQHLKSLTSLNLCCNNFSSSLPKSITNLVSLSSIDLSQNELVGDFPSGFGSVPGLKYLNASGNNFSGDLPADLGNATLLETLDVRGNFFQGSIHGSYRVLQKLKFLGLSGNNLSGLVPPELAELPALETMILGYNFFGGGIPAELGNLTNLKYLDIAIANLSGEIPPELGKLKKLDTMFLYQNNLEGRIPSTIGNLTSMVNFDVSFNLLSGEIPDEISELKNLQLLNLMGNRLSGSVPTGLALLPQLQVLALWNNSFTGSLPSDLGKSSASLRWLDVSSNAFSGVIPSGLCHGGNLTKLILFNNALSGPIPTSLTKCRSLFRVRMQNNQLSGTIPVGLGKLPKLQRLELGNNRLTGKIPDDLSSSSSLSFIDLSRNNLQSPLPANILSIPTLQAFIASGNDLGGTIPNQFQDCPSLSVLDLGSNHFTGTIPSSIASCQKLVTLVLRINELNGEIPESLAMMQSLAIIDLSNNSLTGTIPQHFGTSPALETLNVSYNNLSGPVPTNGILRTINPNDLEGNSGLCGGILPPCSKDSSSLSGHEAGVHTKHILTGWLIGISTVLAVVVAALGAHSLYSRYYANGSCFEERFYDTRSGDWPWRLMAFQRLGFTTGDILSCVKESNVIGKGASGIVYRAEIPQSNTVVAVKKLWTPSSSDIEAGNNGGDHNELAGEINLLGKLRHRNIVRLLGFLHNNKEVMVVYEYMQNGNLGDALHGKQRLLLVDWVSRYNIALGVAHGLAYLHHDCHPPVIHRDVKSNNILLDGNLEARVADFGLAKMMIGKNETVSVVAGSYGYIAPEYGYTLKIDEKSDIYSYGVVLLELLTGKRPLDPRFGDSSSDIVEWIRCKMRNKRPLEEVLDVNIGGGNCNHVREEMLLVLQIALLCTAKLPKDRPSMRDVITMLGEAKPRRKSGSINNGGSLSDKDKPVFSPSPVI